MQVALQSVAAATAALLFSIGINAKEADLPCGAYRLAYYELGTLYFTDRQGNPGGVDYEVAQELSRRTGCKFLAVLESRVRTWEQFSRNALDLTLSAIPSREREKTAEFVPYLKGRTFVVARADAAERARTLESFSADQKLTVAVVKGFSYGPYFDAWLQQMRQQRRIVEASDFNIAVKLFEHGRADAILVNPFSLPVLGRNENTASQYRIVYWQNDDIAVGALAMSRTRIPESDRKRLRDALASMLRDGTVEFIVRRHMGEAVARELIFNGIDIQRRKPTKRKLKQVDAKPVSQ